MCEYLKKPAKPGKKGSTVLQTAQATASVQYEATDKECYNPDEDTESDKGLLGKRDFDEFERGQEAFSVFSTAA